MGLLTWAKIAVYALGVVYGEQCLHDVGLDGEALTSLATVIPFQVQGVETHYPSATVSRRIRGIQPERG